MSECPNCLGAKTIMVAKEERGFEYVKCKVCNGSGQVLPSMAQDFINASKPFNDEPIDEFTD